ncbi:MAG: AgmX/PglI C-terminal domain-containing protein [Myxococcales bacterium]|nr:AgmX/PglI C-terminal domain-containing protein [Myxococcota bacterium]MDW8281655.1 AgmX/PglI C-terminal domain-containing protein [Myxococcales bacterium]
MPSGATVSLKFDIYKGDQLIRTVTLHQDIIKVGKLSSSHLRIEDETVSRMHAVIEVSGPNDISIIDLGSTRGTFLNGQKITKAKLQSGDELVLGDTRIVVTVEPAEEQETPAPTMVDVPAPPARITTMGLPQIDIPSVASPVTIPPQMAQPAPPQPLVGLPAAASFDAEAVEVRDGSRAVEVSAMFEDAVLEVRHLTNPAGGRISGLTKALLGTAVAAFLGAFIVFLVAYVQVADIRQRREAWIEAGKPYSEFRVPRDNPLYDILPIAFLLYGTVALIWGLFRFLDERQPAHFTIGTDPKADFHVGEELGTALLPLVHSTGTDFELLFTRQMKGDITEGDKVISLEEAIQTGKARPAAAVGGAFAMPIGSGARINLRLGENTFNVVSTPPPRRMPFPLTVDWGKQAYTGGVFLASALFLLLVFSVPPDPKSLSLDAFINDQRFAKFLIKPPEEREEVPEWLKKKGPDEMGGKGKRHKEEEGKMGKKESKNKTGLYALKGPKDNPDPHLAKQLATEAAQKAGVLGILKAEQGSHLASIFGRDSALGTDAVDVLGGLVGTEIGEAYGVGGLGLVGTGRGGGGTGEGTIGLGNLGTIGKGGGGGSGSGYGRGAGGLGGRRAGAPEVVPGTAEVRGSLDKEIIRRIIRRHINEVKFCYEKELTRKADLMGRVMIQFTIASTGQVVASVVQSSTMNSPPVEQCIAQAVRRWEFPKPMGGGIVVVTYPFVLKASGQE